MEEKWKKIQGYEHYEVSDLGRIRSLHKPEAPIIMKQWDHYKGHKFIYLNQDGSRRKFFVHRLVAEAFIPNVDGKAIVNHIDMDKKNNAIENLEWLTGPENTRHYHATKKAYANHG